MDDGEAARASRGGRRQLSTTGLGGSRSSCTTGSYLPPPKLSIKSDKCEENGSRKDKGALLLKIKDGVGFSVGVVSPHDFCVFKQSQGMG